MSDFDCWLDQVIFKIAATIKPWRYIYIWWFNFYSKKIVMIHLYTCTVLGNWNKWCRSCKNGCMVRSIFFQWHGSSLIYDEHCVYILYITSILFVTISATCSPACQNGGTCVQPNVCNCAPGWRGTFCESRKYRYSQIKPSCYLDQH